MYLQEARLETADPGFEVSSSARISDNRRAFCGFIDDTRNGRIKGWLYTPTADAAPFVTVGGRPAVPLQLNLPREDVNDALGLTGNPGFSFDAGRIAPGDIIELYALTSEGLTLVDSRPAVAPNVDENFLSQLGLARRLSQREGSVAIVCWDGAHNPVGRAKVLYDAAKVRRPAVLFTYLFDEFGGRLWSPLRSTDVDIVTIPWKQRHLYHRALEVAGVTFDTVWICKPRLPSFELARAVAASDAKLILDYDDNEEHFSRSANAKDKAFGTASLSLARSLADAVTSRTVASVSLQNDFGGRLVRHARTAIVSRREDLGFGDLRLVTEEGELAEISAESAELPIDDAFVAPVEEARPFVIGFIGTARAHKAILQAARAIQLFKFNGGGNVQLHVYGDIQPQALREALEANGVTIKQNIPMAELGDHLLAMDVILTGYPSPGDEAVTTYQISSKIGDALAAGKPVLVPNSPSTEDLEGVDGIFLFDQLSFPQALGEALECGGKIELPPEFTLDGAFAAFEEAEIEAASASKAGEVLAALPLWNRGRPAPADAIVLVWKQHDAGVYGRRIDQIARAYKAAYPQQRVVILELMHTHTLKNYEPKTSTYLGEEGLLTHLSRVKSSEGLHDCGVEIRQIVYSASSRLQEEVERFMVANCLLPSNTTLVLFPLIRFCENLIPSFREYRKIVDVVDNQFAWGKAEETASKRFQYAALFREADTIVFNSEFNLRFFADQNLLGDKAVSVVENWYACPPDFKLGIDRRGERKRILYSGNMKDRVDWSLVHKLAGLLPDLDFHLVGTANVDMPHLSALFELDNVIFHGPLEERQTLQLLETIDVAVMPHRADDVSNFMNPLKVHMYIAAGVPVVSTRVPGVEDHPLLTLADTHEQFLAKVREHLTTRSPRTPETQNVLPASCYTEIVGEGRQN